MSRSLRRVGAPGCLLWALAASSSCHEPVEPAPVTPAIPAGDATTRAPLVVTRLGLGVQFQIALVGDDDERLEELARQAFVEVDRLEAIFNNWSATSSVSRFNSTPGTDWQDVPFELAYVVSEAIAMTKRTHGAYDITILPALDAFGFDRPEPRVPDGAELERVLARIGSDKLQVELDPPRIRRSVEGVVLDLSSASKGYVVDRIAAFLREHGIENAFINAGSSSVYALGQAPDGTGWPFEIDDDTTWYLRDESVSTSGKSSRDRQVADRTIRHIFDPQTGQPARREVEFVSIRTPSGLQADMASTAFVVLGASKTLEFIRSDPILRPCDVEMRLFDHDEPVRFRNPPR